MPALPSGQHLAIDPAPLRRLLSDPASPFNAHHLMALLCVDDLFRWLDVLVLKTEDSLTPEERARAFVPPAGAPAGMMAIPTGTRLADWRALAQAAQWSDADGAAFEAFIADRIGPAMLPSLARARAIQEALPRTPCLAGAFAAMWRDGVHPLQDSGED